MISILGKYSNLKYLISGRLFTNLGDSLIYISFMWIIFDLTKDPLFTGIAGFLFSLPEVFSFLMGPIIDKSNKKILLYICGIIQFLLIFILFFLEFSFSTNIWIILAFIPFLSTVTEITYPIQSAMLPTIVKADDLVKANSLMSITNTGVDLAFNAIAGIILAIFSFSSILLSNSVLFIIALLFFTLLKNSSEYIVTDEGTPTDYITDLKEGFNFVKKKFVISLLLPLIFLNFFYAILFVNLPAFADKFIGSALGYGLILALIGVGSLLGAYLSEYLSERIRLGVLMISSFFITGLSWIMSVVLIEHSLVLTALFIIISSAMIGAINVIYASLFQKLPDESMIARVNTVNISLISSCIPIGSLVGGYLSSMYGVGFASYLYGIGFMIISLSLFFSKDIRKLPYIEEINKDYLDKHVI